jgi:TonB family protein
MGEVCDSPRFDSLVYRAVPWTRWASGLVLNASVVLALVLVPVAMHQVVQPRNQLADITLTSPPVPKPVKPIIRTVSPPVSKPVPHVEFHAPPLKSPEAKVVALPPLPVEIPKPVAALQLEAPKIDLPARLPVKQEVVKLDVFQPNPAPLAAQAAPVKSVQTGGFGDSAGISSGTSTRRALAVGGFDSSGGTGTGPAKSKAVVSAGFGAYDATPPPTQTARVIASRETPVEIVSKPKPLYTPEARQKKIEGEVTLEVTFAATGEIHVIRVVHGLGFGLDDSARAAASQIRFHPGTRNGSPVDVTGIVHIVFELS